MADGDITAITILGSIKLPGGGHTQAGAPSQNKTLRWGLITATYDSLGIALDDKGGVKALGFETLDVIDFQVKSIGGAAMADDALYHADLSRDTDKIFMLEDVGVANAAAPTDADAITLAFWALGDPLTGDLT